MLILVGENVMRYRTPSVSKCLPTPHLFNYQGENSVKGGQHCNQETTVDIISSGIKSNFMAYHVMH